MALEIKYYSDTLVQAECARRLSEIILADKKRPVVLLISGGSCLTVLPFLLHHFQSLSDLSFLTIGFVDERFDENNSNFTILTKGYSEFIQTLMNKGTVFLDTRPTKTSQYEMAEWYSQQISTLTSHLSTQNGKLITLLGMGEDGHIAGIVPHTIAEEKQFYEQFLDTNKLVVAYDATGKNPFTKRFTLTYTGLLQADAVVGFIVGEKKRMALEATLSRHLPIYENPALYFVQTEQPVEIFTDIKLKDKLQL